MKQLIVGYGEVGKALVKVLSGPYVVGYVDQDKSSLPFKERPDAMHICIPFTSDFCTIVKCYQGIYKPHMTIIHSTVPVGTSDMLNAVHSPIRGVHPNIAEGIKIFVKYFGGEQAEKAAQIFDDIGIETKVVPSARDTEAAKLWDTAQYGVMIVLNKLIHDHCEENGLDFDLIYTEFNKTYNEGYRQLGRLEVLRPNLSYMQGPIGGHCVMPNLEFLQDSPVYEFVRNVNGAIV